MFDFTATREAEHPSRFLQHYTGYLQADDYVGYHASYRSGRVTHAACWTHARRKFYDIAKGQKTPSLAHEALQFIAQLYAIEAQLRDKPPDERRSIRQRETVPLLAEFKAWLEGHSPRCCHRGRWRKPSATRSPTGRRCRASPSKVSWLPIRISSSARSAPLLWVARPGCLPEAHVAARRQRFSLIETAKLNGIEPFAYLKDVLTRIRSHRTDRLTELLPFNWKPAV